MRFAVYGLLFAALVFLISGGHLLFLPLFFVLPLGGMFGHHRRHGHLLVPGAEEILIPMSGSLRRRRRRAQGLLVPHDRAGESVPG